MNPSGPWVHWQLLGSPRPRTKQLALFGGAALQRKLPIYQEWTTGLAQRPSGRDRDGDCSKCELSQGVKSGQRCVEGLDRLGDGAPILVVYGAPTHAESQTARPYSGGAGYYLRQQVVKHTSGRALRFDYALKCPEKKTTTADTSWLVTACRPYLAGYIAKSKPSRIIAVGYTAVQSVFGLYVDTVYTRRAYARVQGIPAYALMDPAAAARNRFLRRQFERDLEWALTTQDPAEITGETEVLTDKVSVENWLAALDPTRPTVVDVEHEGQIWNSEFNLLCVGMGQDPDKPVVIPANVLLEAREAFTDWLGDPLKPKINQNLKHDRHALYRVFGVDMTGILRDTMLRAHMREPEAPAKLGALAWQVGMGGYKEHAKDLSDEDSKGGKSVAALPPNELHAYNGRDVTATLLVDTLQTARMGKLDPTWDRLVGPAFDALAIVERNGILLSEANVRAYALHLQSNQARLDVALRAFPEVPKGFNPASPSQVGAYVYGVLKLPCAVKTAKGGQSVSNEALEALEDKHASIPYLIELAGLRKQISTYGMNMLEHISPLDGRVHTTFKIVRTGRLSSSGPNMQNVTRPDEEGDAGEWARGCFVAADGNLLVSLDYSQLELRAACALSGDGKMAAAFESGHDFHTMTAVAVFGVKPEEVTQAQRQVGKVINFAIVFGKSEYGIAMAIGQSVERAREILDTLLTTYAKLGAWLRNQVSQAEVSGELQTFWDPEGSRLRWAQRRSLHGIGEIGDSKEAERRRKHCRNVSKNTPIQWLANCFALASLTEAVRWAQEELPEAKVVMTVHDEILFEVPEAHVRTVVEQGKRIMLSWPSGVVKLKVGAEVGKDWGHMVEYK